MKNNKQGFTLIELLVVIAIIGILASIAVPQYGRYRERSFEANAVSLLRGYATAQEAYYESHSTYSNCWDDECVSGPTALPGFEALAGHVMFAHPDSDVHIHPISSDENGFITNAWDQRTSKTFTWDSLQGGLQ